MLGQMFKKYSNGSNEVDDDEHLKADYLDSSSTALLNSSFTRWSAIVDDDSIHYPVKKETALINRCPNETWIDCMKFLNRENLQTLQLVAKKFDLMVEKYFGIYPLRKVHRCKVRTKKKTPELMEILFICLSSNHGHGSTIETDSDLHLWLQHCYIECLEFMNFHFSYQFLLDLQLLDPRLVHINYTVFDYDKRAISIDALNKPVNEDQIISLFNIDIFKKCRGSAFSFEKRCNNFRPSIDILFTLPQLSIIIDFAGYIPTDVDNSIISRWLNQNENVSNTDITARALSLRGFNLDVDSVTNLINAIQTGFSCATQKQPFTLNAHWDEDNWNLAWELEDRNLSRAVSNSYTNEKLTVKIDGKIVITRE